MITRHHLRHLLRVFSDVRNLITTQATRTDLTFHADLTSFCLSVSLSVCLSGVPNHTSHLISLPVCGTPQQPQQQQQTAANRSDKCTCGNLTITLPIVSAHRQLQQQTRPDKQQTTPITEQQNTILQLAFTHLRHFANKSYNRSKLPIPVS